MVYSTPEGNKVWSPTVEEITVHLNLDNATEPVLNKNNEVKLKCTSIDYDVVNDEYICNTGTSIEKPYNLNCLVIKDSSVNNEMYLVDNNLSINDEGFIQIKFKNRTSYKVNCMLAEWEYMKNATNNVNFDNTQNVGEAIEGIKANANYEPFKKPDPMDYCLIHQYDNVARLIVTKN